MNSSDASLGAIYNFRRVGDLFGTSGQPTELQFTSIAQAGYQAVINLALPTSDNALPHEASIVTALGLPYFQIPVKFDAPTQRDYDLLTGTLSAFAGRPIFIHCAANMRVSAFIFLHRVMHLNVPLAEAERDLHAIWVPNRVWSEFIARQLGRSKALSPG